MKQVTPYWIKERHNPQLGKYYIAEGQMSVTKAKYYQKAAYGVNIMHRFDTLEAYQAKMRELGITEKGGA